MKFTNKNFRVDGSIRTIEIFKDTLFIEVYRTIVYLWVTYTSFCKLPFPNEITAMFPVTVNTKISAGKVITW